MGIVFKQSFKNTLITYLGFGIGAMNTLFLYTRFLTDEYFGLVGVILSTAAIAMPLMALGVPNTLVKYFSSYDDVESQKSFLSLMLFLPLLLILPIALLSWLAQDFIAAFLARKNAIVEDYVWYIFLIALAMAYFEIFFAWSKVHMRSVFGNFLKEVFVRVGVSIGLLLVFFGHLSVEGFLKMLVGLYLVRTLIMKLYAYSLNRPSLTFKFPAKTKEIFVYSALILLGGSVAVLLLEIDRFMINQYIAIENVAYYTVSIFIATVIAVPSRSMHQITYPLTAELLNKGSVKELKTLYRKSSLNLFVISGIIFLLIFLNLADLYQLLPETYRGGMLVVLFIGLAKVFDALLGNNNAILFNSEYYRTFLLLGVLLVLLTIVLNIWFIPRFGINGAAIASFIAIGLYNSAKLLFVYQKFNIHPFTTETLKVLSVLLVMTVFFYFFGFSFHPLINIALKSFIMLLMYLGIMYRFRISEDLFGILSNLRQKDKPRGE